MGYSASKWCPVTEKISKNIHKIQKNFQGLKRLLCFKIVSSMDTMTEKIEDFWTKV